MVLPALRLPPRARVQRRSLLQRRGLRRVLLRPHGKGSVKWRNDADAKPTAGKSSDSCTMFCSLKDVNLCMYRLLARPKTREQRPTLTRMHSVSCQADLFSDFVCAPWRSCYMDWKNRHETFNIYHISLDLAVDVGLLWLKKWHLQPFSTI